MAFLKDDFHWHPLHDLHVIAGGILRRQEAELGAGGGGNAFDVPFVLASSVSVNDNISRLTGSHLL